MTMTTVGIRITVLAMLATSIAASQTVVCPAQAPLLIQLAAKEVRRFVYLRTGTLLAIEAAGQGIVLKIDPGLAQQAYRLKSDGEMLTISGGSEVAALYGAYAFAEKLGVRFYLHGDVVPDEKIPFSIPRLDETHTPLFALRGVNPWGSHPFGFDAWSTDDYRAVFTQLGKMRMNFLGIHCYPEGHPYAEPTVWHGLPGDFDAGGQVKRSYVARYFNTLLTPAWGDYRPKRTSEYSLGGWQLFDDEAWAPAVLRGHCPLPVRPEDCNEVFNRVGAQLKEAFSFARQLGIKTCVGTEAPLTLPTSVRERTGDARAVYEGTFRRIMASHPLDYYWIWTPESWTWEGNKQEQFSNTVADIQLALQALKNANAPFRLATAGWVLGPAHDRAAFDKELPKDIPMSAINQNTGATEVDAAFGRITGREKWAIPWLESDNRNGLGSVQLEAGRMRRDAVSAREYGCTGLMGLHWRTEVLSPNASALAQAAWDQSWHAGAAEPFWTLAGQVANYPNARIANSEDAPLYRGCRYDLGAIRLRAPDGSYKVTLKFCEPHFKSFGERIFDVQIQGRTVLTNLDIFARVGQFAALDFAFEDVLVTNGTLTVELVAGKSLPCISAVAVESPGFTSKINCGGAAHGDWQADAARPRGLPCEDFYADWAQANFGLAEAGRVFAAVDGRVPQVTDGGCPAGSLTPMLAPWTNIAAQFRFVDELANYRPRVRGAGNLERFDYWLNTFRYHRALARIRCAMGAKHPEEVRMAWAEAYTFLLATVNSPGALGMVVNMENHPGWELAAARSTSQPWPREYQGRPRLVVPTVRSIVERGEALTVRIITLDRQPMRSVAAHVGPLGRGGRQLIPAAHRARGVYEVKLPAAVEDVEYYLTAQTAEGATVFWPATAPQISQTVVVIQP